MCVFFFGGEGEKVVFGKKIIENPQKRAVMN